MLAWFVPIGLTRLIDGDEGYLLYAARLVSEGENLYTDFFCPQTPLVPYVFSLWYRVFGAGWYSARTLAGVFAAGSGLLVFLIAYRYSASLKVAAVAAVLCATCGYSLGWFPIVKTYGLTVFFGLLGILLLERGGRWSCFWAGLSIALALEARLYVGIIGVNAILFVLRRAWMGRARGAWVRRALIELGQLALGAWSGLMLLVPPFVRDFETAFFGIFEFASVRFPSQTTLFGPWEQKYDTLLAELGLVGQDGAGSAQLLILVFLGVIAWTLPGLTKNRLTATVWPTILVVNLLPAFTFPQYVCLVVPFVAIEAGLALSRFAGHLSVGAAPRLRLLLPVLAVFAAMGVIDLRRFCITGVGVPGVGGYPPPWDMKTVTEAARVMDGYHATNVASFWPGYFVSSQTRVIPELANHFGFHVSGRYDEARMKRLHLISNEDMSKSIVQKSYPLIVDGNWHGDRWKTQIELHYRLDRVSDNVRFWVPKSQ